MKRILLIVIIIGLFLPIIPIFAENNTGSLSISATSQAKKDHLAIVKVSASAPIETTSISGTVTYDKKLAVFDVIKSDNLDGWTFNIDTSTAGQIKFTGKYTSGGDGPIESDRTLFTIRFIAVNEGTANISVSASGKGKGIEVVQTEVVVNSKEIEEAIKHNEGVDNGTIEGEKVPIPNKIIEIVEERKEVEKDVGFDKLTNSIVITNPKSNDTYLKSITVNDATISPSFSKLTTAYKVTIDSEKDVNINYVKEDEKATVVIQQEVNNQIIITVTAEDGSTSAYVLTIVRVKNYDSTNPVAPDDNQSNTPNPTPNSNALVMDKQTLITLAGGSAISVIGILIGTILVVQAKREMGY